MDRQPSVIVVGSGNAALCAAIAAAEGGARVTVVEAGTPEHFGGNTRYTAGAIRFAYADANALAPLLAGCDDPRLAASEFGAYPTSEFAADLSRLSGDDPLGPLQHTLVERSYETVRWLRTQGVRFEPIFSRQSFFREGRHHFWGALPLAAHGEGQGLIDALRKIAEDAGVVIRLGSRVVSLHEKGGRIAGVILENETLIPGGAVVLACGGFEADADLRAQYLGSEWREAVVRGTPLNRGDGLRMALRVGAATAGAFSACHAVCMDSATPSFERSVLPHRERKNFRKISYPFGLMINSRGERFVDEGADFRNYTYAQYGREVLRQPGGIAWQLFDAEVAPLLYEEYQAPGATRVDATSLDALVAKLDGVDGEAASATLRAYNDAVDRSTPFDPTRKDGRGTRGLALPKSNWAMPLEHAPFVAYRVTCGITFTYGGLAIDTGARVFSETGTAIPGLYAAGEIVGALFRGGYPGGSGLSAGAVFGRAAGESAAADAR